MKLLILIIPFIIACSSTHKVKSRSVARQDVSHSHLHIAPRFIGDGHRMGFSGNLIRPNFDKLIYSQVTNGKKRARRPISILT